MSYTLSKWHSNAACSAQVLTLCAVILGHIADDRLSVIGHKYLKEIELRLPNDSNAARQEITQLAEGMRNISLPTNTTSQVLQLFNCNLLALLMAMQGLTAHL